MLVNSTLLRSYRYFTNNNVSQVTVIDRYGSMLFPWQRFIPADISLVLVSLL